VQVFRRLAEDPRDARDTIPDVGHNKEKAKHDRNEAEQDDQSEELGVSGGAREAHAEVHPGILPP